MLIIIKVSFLLRNNMTFPTEEQLFALYRFLVFLRNDNMYWHSIEPRGDRILVKVEEPKGEIDLRMFYIYADGEVKPDEFRD